jgi:hypothetical protein
LTEEERREEESKKPKRKALELIEHQNSSANPREDPSLGNEEI